MMVSWVAKQVELVQKLTVAKPCHIILSATLQSESSASTSVSGATLAGNESYSKEYIVFEYDVPSAGDVVITAIFSYAALYSLRIWAIET